MTVTRWARRALAWTVVVVLLAACGSTAATTVARPERASPRTAYVAVGGSDAVGNGTDDPLLDAWPQQFFRHSLPLAAVFVNAAVPGSTVAAALTDQAPLAASSRATVVSVWLVSADLLDGTPPSTYGTQLLQLLTTLRNGGTTTVLVGNVPQLDQVPGYVACRDGATDLGRGLRCPVVLPSPAALAATSVAYNQVIAKDAAASGAVPVDLNGAVAASVAGGGALFLAPSGADLSTAGSTLVARTFGDELLGASGHTA